MYTNLIQVEINITTKKKYSEKELKEALMTGLGELEITPTECSVFESIEIINIKTFPVICTKCIACNGSGYYDSNHSPKCSYCNGTGKAT